MKLIALYLPQFHRIPENDTWWGEGFTEWANTRRAGPLFKEHYQPREPLDDNYYDLCDISTMRWQVRLAAEHGIDGFCFYHYWFGGRLLLQRPIENYLRHRELNLPFCLSWANEPWTRSWDGLNSEVLVPQKYGSESAWEEHFVYLLRFFRDPRYIKIEGLPVFLIYRASSIPHVDDMVSHWRKRAIAEGLGGIYLVETLTGFQDHPAIRTSNAVFEFEPMFTLKHRYPRLRAAADRSRNWIYYGGLNTKNYEGVWRAILNKNLVDYSGRQLIPGAFVDWDNSPRRSANGLMMLGASPDKFERALRSLIVKSRECYEADVVIINAWNEWAEGAYLEPDKRFGCGYLESVRRARDALSV